MEFFTADMLLLFFTVAVIAGCVDAIAGGGGLLVVPVMLWAGIPPAQALGTTKLQASFGTLTATLNYFKNGLIDMRTMRLSVWFTFLGAAFGSVTVQSVDPAFLYKTIPVVLILVGVYFLFMPGAKEIDSKKRMADKTFAVAVGTSIGFYDGFLGPGTGSFFVIAFVALQGYSLIKATAHTKVLNLTSNIAALMFFIFGGNVLWAIGLTMGAGQMIGGYIGSHLALTHGNKLIRPLIVIVSFAISLKLIFSQSS